MIAIPAETALTPSLLDDYVAVIGEIAVLPLALGLTLYALAFSILNGIVLWIRISAKNSALRGASDLSL